MQVFLASWRSSLSSNAIILSRSSPDKPSAIALTDCERSKSIPSSFAFEFSVVELVGFCSWSSLLSASLM